MREPIVIGTSLAEGSDAVVKAGVHLAHRAGCPALLVHAMQPLVPLAAPDAGWVLATDWEEQTRTELAKLLHAQAQRCGLHEVPGSRSQIHDGHPDRVLAEVTRAVSGRLVVVGSRVARHGRGLLATTADRLLRVAEVPVLVVRSQAPFPPHRVLYAVDLSEVSIGALRVGRRWEGALGSVEQREMVFALDPVETVGWSTFTPQQVEEFADLELHKIAERHGGSMPARVVVGSPEVTIQAAIRSTGPDLVVLGTHGRRGVQRFVLGSFAQAILDSNPQHVLVVPPGAAARALAEAEPVTDARYRRVEPPPTENQARPAESR